MSSSGQKGQLVAFQSKRCQSGNDIGSSAVQTFTDGMLAHKANQGNIVTTSTFSAAARELAREHASLDAG